MSARRTHTTTPLREKVCVSNIVSTPYGTFIRKTKTDVHLNVYILNMYFAVSKQPRARLRRHDSAGVSWFASPPIYFEYVLKYAMVKAGVVTDKANRILSLAVNVGMNQNAKNSVKNRYMTLFLNMENPTAR